MKKIILMLVLSAGLVSQSAMAQANTKFTLVTDAYYAWPNLEVVTAPFLAARSYGDDITNIVTRGIGPTGLRTDFFVADRLSIGVDAIYSGFKVDYTKVDTYMDGATTIYDTNRYSDQFNRLRMQIRVNRHWDVENKKFDGYWGFAAGTNQRYNTRFIQGVETDQEIDRLKWRKNGGAPITLPFSARICFGMRYYFTKNTGIHFEAGLGGPLFSAGVSSRFGLKKPSKPAN